MTEKRFKYYAFDGFEDNGRQMSSYEVEETLNRFQELSIEDLKKIEQLEKENKELKERNNRQAKQLDDLYRLIEQKDWRALTDIIDDFKKAEEQLQSEWKCYE